MRIAPSILLLSFLLPVSASEKGPDRDDNSFSKRKRMLAVKVDQAPVIDGNLDDEIWSAALVAGDFVQYQPYQGEDASYPTEVRLLYDDKALYIAAKMFDPYPDSIYTELGGRDADRNLNADHFNVDISPYNDGTNGFTLKVSASGVQTDSRQTTGNRHGKDVNWDAVWESEVRITEDGWVAELKIPYSVMRFPQKPVQEWGINFWREIRRYREWSTWNPVDREVGTSFNHLGEIGDIKDLKPPLRLSMTPYISGYLEKYGNSNEWGTSYNGGLDLKLGLTESFTLDATLIPDFGQVQSDDQVLNLSPYEVKYNERRPFFMEGTELFNKGGIFYSRRIASQPRQYYDVYDVLEDQEKVTKNPSEAAMINATKVSGRTRGGLGIGVFNAMTRAMNASITDTLTGESRQVQTEPFTNYSLLVVDQSLKNNSYISLVNTNVWRDARADENYYTANVTATDFKFQNDNRLYSVSGKAAVSQKYYDDTDTDLGYMVNIGGGKTGGIFRYQYKLELMTDTYDPNDLGYLRRNNTISNEVEFSYNTFTPFWRILWSRNTLTFRYNQIQSYREFADFQINLMTFVNFRNQNTTGFRMEYKPMGTDDYFEPRVDGWYYHSAEEFSFSTWMNTDSSKDLILDARVGVERKFSSYDQWGYNFSFKPKYRFSDRFSLEHNFEYRELNNDIGYVSQDETEEQIYFGMRQNRTITNTLSANYIFSAKSYLSFRMRHYWSVADYRNDNYYLLQRDGRLREVDYGEDPSYSYNAFNIDMVYTWRFAPGSELSLVWKNALYSGENEIEEHFGRNLKNLFDQTGMNSISLKVLYYLDYQNLLRRN